MVQHLITPEIQIKATALIQGIKFILRDSNYNQQQTLLSVMKYFIFILINNVHLSRTQRNLWCISHWDNQWLLGPVNVSSGKSYLQMTDGIQN